MEGNSCAKDDYKKKLFQLLPTLEVVDGEDKTGEEVDTSVYGEDEEFDECGFLISL